MADDLTITLGGMDYLAVVLAALAAFLIGFLWYGPIFGKKWAAQVGISMDEKVSPKKMMGSMGLTLLGALLMAYVLFHSIAVWLPTLWAANFDVAAATDSGAWFYATMSTLFIWLGFFIPHHLSRTAWEKGSWTLFGINVGYDLVRLAGMSFILAYMM